MRCARARDAVVGSPQDHMRNAALVRARAPGAELQRCLRRTSRSLNPKPQALFGALPCLEGSQCTVLDCGGPCKRRGPTLYCAPEVLRVQHYGAVCDELP